MKQLNHRHTINTVW